MRFYLQTQEELGTPMPQTSSLPLALKFLLTPAGTKGSALHKSKLELCRNWGQSCFMKMKAHLALTADSSSYSDESPTASVGHGGRYYWPAAVESNSPGLLLKPAFSGIWEAPEEVLRPWTPQGAGEQAEFLEAFSKWVFHSGCCDMLLLTKKVSGLLLDTHLLWKACRVVQGLNLWVLFKATCGKTHSICIFWNSREKKQKTNMHFFVEWKLFSW